MHYRSGRRIGSQPVRRRESPHVRLQLPEVSGECNTEMKRNGGVDIDSTLPAARLFQFVENGYYVVLG